VANGSAGSDTAAKSSITNFTPDAPTIDVCFYGPVFRKYFGQPSNPDSTQPFTFVDPVTGLTLSIPILPRIGAKKVSGLRHGKQVANASRTDVNDPETTPWGLAGQTVYEYMAEQNEYIPDIAKEFTAETQALLVATSWLNRPQIVVSGEEHFGGFCGHEPDGEIRRVTVNVDGKSGISEVVTYSNDFPSLFHEPDIELLRRIHVNEALRASDKLKRNELIDEQKQQAATEALEAAQFGGETLAAQRLWKQNSVLVKLVAGGVGG
jgi:hypothetical protein